MTSPTEAPRTAATAALIRAHARCHGSTCTGTDDDAVCRPHADGAGWNHREATAPASPDVMEALGELIRVSKSAGMNAASDFGYLPSQEQADEEEISEAVQIVYAAFAIAALPAATPAPLDEAFLEFGQWLADNPAMLSGIVEAIELGEPDEYRATVDAFLTAYAATPPTDENDDAD